MADENIRAGHPLMGPVNWRENMYPFKEGSFAPRNGWYVAAFPHEITRTLQTRWILNEPVVLYRKESGQAVALGGRCPHRHFPLGESKLIGDAIQCGYHGITFGPDGRCIRIPSQVGVPAVYRVAKYPLIEKGLWCWIWPGDPKLADETLIPNPEEIGLDAPGFLARPFYSLEVKGRYQLLNDNLLDLTHLGFLHGSSIGTEDNAAITEQRDLDSRRLRSRRYMENTQIPELTARFTGYRGPVDRVTGMDFFFPSFHAGIEEVCIAKSDATRPGEVLRKAKVWHAVTPSTFDTTRYFFAMGSRSDKELDSAFVNLESVVGEDVFATEQIERMLQKMPSVPQELKLKSDSTAVQGRRVLQGMMDAELTAQSAEPV